jgi:iron complex outermembrane receptor protein
LTELKLKSIPLAIVQVIASGALSVLAAPAFAQDTTSDPATAKPMQRVEVTGSLIRRSQVETASSVQTLSRADIEKSGKSSVAELLQTLAVDNQGSVPASFGSGFAAGASGISLRGLGTSSTLVLLNGRRVAAYGLADDGQKVFADLNIIPMEAVERVEILKDGASATYGSDAIAGVVNIILRKDYVGTTLKATGGTSRYHDGQDSQFAITHGFGSLDTDRYNVLTNLEYNKKREVYYRDRDDRGYIGRNDLRDYGFSAQQSLGGTGAIVTQNSAGSAINGNVRNPLITNPDDPLYQQYYNRGNLNPGTGFTRTFPGAACSNFTTHPQGDPNGGCLIDASQVYQQILPSQENVNGFLRGTLQISPSTQAYTEINLYHARSESETTPSGVSSSVGSPAGPVSNAGVALGANHPDNPYFGTAARLRYLAADVGPRHSEVTSTFQRFVAGLKGTVGAWDFDTAALYSTNRVSNQQNGYLQRDVAFALLNPTAANVAAANLNPAYAALPAGTYWRIGENAGLNSPALYAALSPQIQNRAQTRVSQLDFRASRELGQLPGGAIGIAAGAEYRRESTELQPTTGTQTGNIIGLGYSAYKGSRNIGAVYAEVLAPILKSVEATVALRADHFSDVGNAYTPKVGLKWTPVKELAVRGTFAKGFRAPNAAENGVGGLAAYSTSDDPVRCNLGIASACDPASVAIITSPNSKLSPERSKSYNVGVIWDPLPGSSVSVDLWQIKRTNEINQQSTAAALAAGQVSRDPSTATSIPGDPGAITAILANYVNSNQTQVRGLDLDARQRFNLNNYGKLTIGANWTHLFKWERTEQDGSVYDYAGTHGNCDVSNCMGTPDDRVNLSATWERETVRVTAVANYRGAIANTLFKNDPAGCASTYANGNDAPGNCRLASFTTIDLTARWMATRNLEVFGSVQNLFDRVAPLDPLTYGAQSYNPLDFYGAMGRYFTAGVKYKF